MKRRNFIKAALLVAMLVLAGTGQAWAIGTAAGTDISNTASVTFTINGNTTSKTSSPATFKVDQKVRPLVTNLDAGSIPVVAGANDRVLAFRVTNEGNSSGGSDYFQLSYVGGASDNFDMNNVEIWEDTNNNGTLETGTDTLLSTADSRVVSIPNGTGTNSKRYLIVADTPLTATTAGQTAVYNLVATAWSGATDASGKLNADADGNNATLSEVVYADDASAGDVAADAAKDGKHSDDGTYIVSAPIAVSKSAGDGTSGYHIPGDEVSYTISVTNSDVNQATSVTIYDEIPANVKFKRTSLSCPAVGGFPAEFHTAAKGSVPVAGWSTTDPALVGGVSPANHVRCSGGTVNGGNTTATMTFVVIID